MLCSYNRTYLTGPSSTAHVDAQQPGGGGGGGAEGLFRCSQTCPRSRPVGYAFQPGTTSLRHGYMIVMSTENVFIRWAGGGGGGGRGGRSSDRGETAQRDQTVCVALSHDG